MEFLTGLVVLGLVGYVLLVAWFGMIDSAANLAKIVIKQAIQESKQEDSGDWDDLK